MSERVLSEGWVLASIDQVSCKGGQRKPDAAEQFIYVDIGSIDRESKVIASPQRLSGTDAPSRARKVIRAGDVLVSLTRPNLNAVALVGKEYDGQIASTGFEVIRPVGVDSRFVFFLVRDQAFIDAISGSVQGALYPAAKSTDVKSYQFPLPSFEEQKAIVDKLDKLLAQVKNLKARLDAIPAILKRFRQSVLEAAVSGRLTGEWRETQSQESAKTLLIEIARARKARLQAEVEKGSKESLKLVRKIQKHSPQLPEAILPDGWKWTTFMSSMEKVVDCHNKTAPYTEDGVPLIRTPDIRDGKISLDKAKYVDEPTYRYWSRRCPPQSGDIIFTREAPMGEAGIVPKGVTLCMGQRMMLLRPLNDFVKAEYVLINTLSPSFQRRMIEKAVGTGVKHLRVSDVESLTYPLAPVEEQAEIVRRVDQLFAFADQIAQQVKNAQARVNKLTQSILAKAFRGELTGEWRAANPELISGENSAEALLERIKAEKVNQKPVGEGTW